jgi:hypothetical protein
MAKELIRARANALVMIEEVFIPNSLGQIL